MRISNVRHHLVGRLTPADAVQDVPELVDAYPENNIFGTLPVYGFYIGTPPGSSRPVRDIRLSQVTHKDL